MKSIIIAAGMGQRLSPLTDDKPKCMLPLGGKPVLERIQEHYRSLGITDQTIVTGYKNEKILLNGASEVFNSEFRENNILHSMMYARSVLEKALEKNEDVIVSYSDIYYGKDVLERLIPVQDDITIIADKDWKDNYLGRTLHPETQAELVVVDEEMNCKKIGKDLNDLPEDLFEFIGLFKIRPKGIEKWIALFDELNNKLGHSEKFQNSKSWKFSYLTDFFQELTDRGQNVKVALISGGWLEFDTKQDYEKLQTLNLDQL